MLMLQCVKYDSKSLTLAGLVRIYRAGLARDIACDVDFQPPGAECVAYIPAAGRGVYR